MNLFFYLQTFILNYSFIVILSVIFFFVLCFIKTQPFVKREPVKTEKKYRNNRVPFQAGFTVLEICKLCTESLEDFLVVWLRTVILGYLAALLSNYNWFLALERNMVTSSQSYKTSRPLRALRVTVLHSLKILGPKHIITPQTGDLTNGFVYFLFQLDTCAAYDLCVIIQECYTAVCSSRGL